jgi:hypothetical protein
VIENGSAPFFFSRVPLKNARPSSRPDGLEPFRSPIEIVFLTFD